MVRDESSVWRVEAMRGVGHVLIDQHGHLILADIVERARGEGASVKILVAPLVCSSRLGEVKEGV